MKAPMITYSKICNCCGGTGSHIRRIWKDWAEYFNKQLGHPNNPQSDPVLKELSIRFFTERGYKHPLDEPLHKRCTTCQGLGVISIECNHQTAN